MKRIYGLLSMAFLVSLTLCAACKRGGDSPDLSALGPSSAATSTVLAVGSPHCPGGGIGMYTGKDANGNSFLDPSEYLKGTPVCDALTDDGKPAGNSLLVMVTSEPTGTAHCAAGGLKVLSGPDANRNGVLDAGEAAFTEYLCNGTPGASSAAGITVAVVPPGVTGTSGREKKAAEKPAPAKKPQAAADKASKKAAPKPAAEAQSAPAAPAKKDAAAPASPPKKADKKEQPASPDKPKAEAPKADVPKGWTSVNAGSPQLAKVMYKIEGRYITVRFKNLSTTSSVRFRYTIRWKANLNGTWTDESTLEGISFSLKPEESLDRDVRTEAREFKDVVVDVEVKEAD